MKLVTVQGSALKILFEVLQSILTDVNIYFTSKGVSILAIDTARVSLVGVDLRAENFEEYECATDVTAGVNMANLYKLLKSVTSNDVVSMSIDTPAAMRIDVSNTDKKSSTRYDLKLLDIDETILQMPAIDMSIVTTLPSAEFQRICRDMNGIGSEITMTRRDASFIVKCSGDFASQETTVECSDDTAAGKRVSGTYLMKYIMTFAKAAGLCAHMQIFQESDAMPVVFKYNIASLGEARFYLAPKATE